MRASNVNGLQVDIEQQCAGNVLPSALCGGQEQEEAPVSGNTSGTPFNLPQGAALGPDLPNQAGTSVVGFSADTENQRQVQIGFLVTDSNNVAYEGDAQTGQYTVPHDATGVRIYLVVLANSFDIPGAFSLQGDVCGAAFTFADAVDNSITDTGHLLVSRFPDFTDDAEAQCALNATLSLLDNSMTVTANIVREPAPESED